MMKVSLFTEKLKSRSFWANLLRITVILVPAIVCALLVRANATDTRLNDDWMLGETLVKERAGTLTWHDIVEVQMEHRLAVPRLLVLLLHHFTKDMRIEMVLTFALISGLLWNLLWLLRNISLKGGIKQWWGAAALMSLTLYSPVQYQTMLWGCTFTSILPGFFLSLAMVAWWSGLGRWKAFVCAGLAAIGGMMSFASALNIWPLMLVVILLAKPEMEWKQRRKYALLWLVLSAVSVALYFTNFKNAVRPEFAYNQGESVTMQHSMGVFFESTSKAFKFVLTILGCHLGRGWNQDNVEVSQFFGAITMTLIFVAAALMLRKRANLLERVSRALPWIIMTMQAVQTGVMIGMGRLWVSHSLSQAVTARYCAYVLYATVGLIGLAALGQQGLLWEKEAMPRVLRRWRGGRRHLATVAAGCLVVVQAVEWSYGEQMMNMWHSARMQGMAMLKFLYLLPDSNYLAKIEGGDGHEVARLAKELDKYKLLYPVPFKNRKLDNFKIMKNPLPGKIASFDRLSRDPNKGLMVEGFSAFAKDWRPADAIVLTSRKKGSKDWYIFGLVDVNFGPWYLHLGTQRDYEFISNERFTSETMAPWAPNVLEIGPPPSPTDEIAAWAVDAEKNSVNRVPEGRSTSKKPAPTGTIVYPGRPK